MKMNWKIFILIVAILVVGAIFSFFTKSANEDATGKYDDFAKCLTDENVVFYGAFWCSHCQKEKQLFGSSEKYLPYVECSTPEMKQTQNCKDKKIESYPTWEFADGSRITGEVSFQNLAEKTSCPLPQ